MVINGCNWTNSWGYEKPKMVTWFLLAPWKAPFCVWWWWGAGLYSFTHHSAFNKNDFVPGDLISPSFEHFQHLQLDFIQLPLRMGYQYVLAVVCMFSRWDEAFPCCKADTLTVAKKLLENVFSLYIPMFIGI